MKIPCQSYNKQKMKYRMMRRSKWDLSLNLNITKLQKKKLSKKTLLNNHGDNAKPILLLIKENNSAKVHSMTKLHNNIVNQISVLLVVVIRFQKHNLLRYQNAINLVKKKLKLLKKIILGNNVFRLNISNHLLVSIAILLILMIKKEKFAIWKCVNYVVLLVRIFGIYNLQNNQLLNVISFVLNNLKI